MATLEWDKVGDRVYQTGVDHGVLYLPDGSGVPWNGLLSVTESFNREVKTFYLEGIKFLESHVLGEYSAELRAFTYPDEFDEINGIVLDDGILYHDQNPLRFGLSYRTLIGDDVEGTDRGYKIHILWNLMANPSSIINSSVNDKDVPLSFGWTISGTPVIATGHKPTCHVSIDSTKIDPLALAVLEAKLYGSESSDPSLPSLMELQALDDVLFTDNGDGTWTAVGPDHLFTMISSTEFEITEVDAVYLDADTYEITY